jgi:hypothetical protein
VLAEAAERERLEALRRGIEADEELLRAALTKRDDRADRQGRVADMPAAARTRFPRASH